MNDESIHERHDQDAVMRWSGQWRPRGGWRTIPLASVALTFALGGCSLGIGGTSAPASSQLVPTPQTTTVAARSSNGPVAPAAVYTSRSAAHQAQLTLEIRRGSCSILPVLDDLHQGTQRYGNVESAIEMQLYGSAPADDKDAISYFQHAQSALRRMDPPARLTQVQLLLQSAADSFLSASQGLRPEIAKNKVKVLPTHRAAYKRGKALVSKAKDELQRVETKAGVPAGDPCPGYTAPSQNVFDNSELDFTTSLSHKKRSPAPAQSQSGAVTVAAAATPETRLVYVTRGVVIYARPTHPTPRPAVKGQPRYSVPTPEPTYGPPIPAPATKAPRPTLLSIYLRSQDLGLTHLLDASDALSTAIRDLQQQLFPDAEMQLSTARQALFGEKSRLTKQKPPTADLRLVRDREHRAINAYVNAYGYAVRALTSERLSQVKIPKAFGNGTVVEFESPAASYLKSARNGMQRAGVRWSKARRLLHSIHP